MTEIRRLGRLSPVTDFLVCALDVIFCGRRAEIDGVASIDVNPVSSEAQTLKILVAEQDIWFCRMFGRPPWPAPGINAPSTGSAEKFKRLGSEV